ncbi:SDR family NAD(P)-dependent oxidoreductase [Nevskia ramosa]|uniref:SDR family NAD(P)-dependent oxidoreductase n=1 Tax=Nevskia ramosa TaxID=64002 RepID=UPI003D1395F5
MSLKPISECGVVILGGTAGVGWEAAAQFAEQGARVLILGRNDERGAAACAKLLERVPAANVGFVRVDATIAAEAVRAEAECRERLGAIDVLVCTTGPSAPPRLMHNIPIDDLQQRIEEIMLPPLHMVHATLPGMRAQRAGAIVVVASDAGKIPTPGETMVGAAMGAILTYCKTAALECKREQVRINLLTPSLIAGTPGAQLIFNEPFSAKMFEKASAMAHLGVADCADQASMIVYLASPAARRMTGQAISINGGISVA